MAKYCYFISLLIATSQLAFAVPVVDSGRCSQILARQTSLNALPSVDEAVAVAIEGNKTASQEYPEAKLGYMSYGLFDIDDDNECISLLNMVYTLDAESELSLYREFAMHKSWRMDKVQASLKPQGYFNLSFLDVLPLSQAYNLAKEESVKGTLFGICNVFFVDEKDKYPTYTFLGDVPFEGREILCRVKIEPHSVVCKQGSYDAAASNSTGPVSGVVPRPSAVFS